MGFFDIGFQEIIIVLVVALLVLGPQRLPEIARKMGKIYRSLRKVTTDFTKEFTKAIDIEDKELKALAKSVKDDVKKLGKAVDTETKGLAKTVDTGTKDFKKVVATEAEKIEKVLDTEAKDLKKTLDTEAEDLKKTLDIEAEVTKTADAEGKEPAKPKDTNPESESDD